MFNDFSLKTYCTNDESHLANWEPHRVERTTRQRLLWVVKIITYSRSVSNTGCICFTSAKRKWRWILVEADFPCWKYHQIFLILFIISNNFCIWISLIYALNMKIVNFKLDVLLTSKKYVLILIPCIFIFSLASCFKEWFPFKKFVTVNAMFWWNWQSDYKNNCT